jgi:trk system potassium uptake protein TrkA
MPRKESFLVIGLGQFGMALVEELHQHGAEVMAVDVKESRVEAAKNHATHAEQADATREDVLAGLNPPRWTACICAIGDDGREASMVVTALLKRAGAKRLIARATDRTHALILRAVGADEVLNPEAEGGQRMALKLVRAGVLERTPLGTDFVILEMTVPRLWQGQSLAELGLRQRYQVNLLGLRRSTSSAGGEILLPEPDLRLLETDILILASRTASIEALVDEVAS